ncbi:MAG: hypothetical protein KF681_14710 [Bdellovibrionaceae bacterium]|nr:hypothetical protein [Pseudobdellovibrionaceae bacterium]
MRISWKAVFFENFSYKVVALFISLILWVTILGRRDFQVTKNVELDLAVATGVVLESQSVDHVKVRVAGPRTALRKFLETGATQVLNVDVSGYKPGTYRVTIPTQKLDLPFGVKILSVKPAEIEIHLR